MLILSKSRAALSTALKPIQENAQALEIGVVSYGETLDVFNQTTGRDIRYLTPLVFALIALTLLWVFRLTRPWELGLVLLLIVGVSAVSFSPELFSGAALPVDLALTGAVALLVLVTYKPLASLYLTLGVVGLSGVWAFGLLGFLGVPVNFLMAAVFPLLMGIGDDYAIHLLHRYEEERCKKHPGPQAIRIALTRTGRAISADDDHDSGGVHGALLRPKPAHPMVRVALRRLGDQRAHNNDDAHTRAETDLPRGAKGRALAQRSKILCAPPRQACSASGSVATQNCCALPQRCSPSYSSG
jgi:hypothetical protein